MAIGIVTVAVIAAASVSTTGTTISLSARNPMVTIPAVVRATFVGSVAGSAPVSPVPQAGLVGSASTFTNAIGVIDTTSDRSVAARALRVLNELKAASRLHARRPAMPVVAV